MDIANTIEISGDKYVLQKTFDVLDCTSDICGFDVLGGDRKFLFHFDEQGENSVISEIKWKIYRRLL